MNYFRNWSVGSKWWLLVFTIVAGVFFAFEFALGKATMDITEQHVYEAERNQVKIVVDLIDVFEQSKRNEVARFSKLFGSYFKLPITVDKTHTSIVGGRYVPTLRLRGKTLHFDHTIPDRFTSQSSDVATIFAKAGNDFVRISTSLKKQNGERAVGTWLKRSHPSYQSLLAGKKYAGLATLFGTQYMTEYTPIFGDNDEVIGVKFVGIDVTLDVAALKSKLNSIKIGKTGHLYALNTKEGLELGTLTFHPTREGVNILEQRDAYGHTYVKDMLLTKSGTARLTLRDADNEVTNMLVAYEHLRGRNWLIVAQVPEEEMMGDINTMRTLYSAISVGAMLLLAGIMMTAIINMTRDIAERKKVERALQLTQFSVNQASFPIFWISEDGRIQFANDAASYLLGYSNEELLSFTARDITQNYPIELWRKHWRKLKEETALNTELTLLNRQRQPIFVEVSSNYLEYDGEEYNFAFIRDITEKKKAEEVIWHQANYDSLTGLPNRRMFIDSLHQEIRKSSSTGLPAAILFIDLDDFKDVNDMLGHDTGDALLREVAQRLKDCVREADTIARLGGDEFTIIMSSLHTRGPIARVCQTILQHMAEPFYLDGEVAYISVSIGITLYPDDGNTIENLLINADQAMYSAKQQGRNRYQYFTPSMQKAGQKRKRLITELRQALGEDQMYVVYQPIVELSSGNVHKAEALVRWKHPKRGMISPVDFIPIAEETGMIHRLGHWIFQTAASQADAWRKTIHPEFQVNINLSPVQLRREGRTSALWLDFMKNSQFTGASVVAEITEGVLLDASKSVIDQLLSFRDAGIQVAIDDFGTGYSSLSYLKKFDIDYIKIDRNFVTGLAHGSEDLALCEAIIVMAHKLDILVIAEGVETTQQRDLLLQAGCNYAQGDLYSKAVTAEEFDAKFNVKADTNLQVIKSA